MSFRSLAVDTISEEQQVLINHMQSLSVVNPSQSHDPSIFNQAATQVRALLTKGNVQDALSRALEVANQLLIQPITQGQQGGGSEELVEKIALLINDVLSSFNREQGLPAVIKNLRDDEQILLLKFIYYGLARPAKFNCPVMLNWHEKTVQVAGVGGIVRVLSDRRSF
ncbi:hypothetical protein BB559_000994 [Furculomyces boomerangus]|uniref:Actin-related protein 2/3 complex subunit 5 n=2 Tax=Harpellales TaxID=61421 RepID=A0A2T9YEA3_9FUNG|nr:hypothetical protein BB559_004505 [Furculomyces boomerangus]PVU99132.1 hypothetical protein BB559_000994 [Furculomyces boomerangus]PWA02943.1 hypothetical protein BB558_000901 [Smittium angustum]